MHPSLSGPEQRGARAYSEPPSDEPDTIEHLGGRIDHDQATGAVVSLRHLEHPDWVVTFVFGASGPAALIVKPYVPIPQSDPMTQFDQSLAQWSRAEVGAIPDTSPLITARLLRRLPIGELEAWARGWLRASAQVLDPFFPHLREWFGDDDRAEGRRGRNQPDSAYATLAAAYVAHVAAGGKLRGLADAHGWSESTVRNRLTEARRRGLLTSAPKGRSGGELTERCTDLLAQMREED